MKDLLRSLMAHISNSLSSAGRKSERDDQKEVPPGETMAQQLVLAFGGEKNIEAIDACITRLRIEVKDIGIVKQEMLKTLGAAGVVIAGNNMQVIFGPRSEELMRDMQEYVAQAHTQTGPGEERRPSKPPHQMREKAATLPDSDTVQKSIQWLKALGGISNIERAELCAITRIRFKLKESGDIDEKALKGAGVGAIIHIDGDIIHLLAGFDAEQYAAEINRQLHHQ